ncbi:hypothetical protein [Noviherbaspirillum pedocola]|uniref:Uncharacterized protein n=1 Tax=Noviherbaspirillum pedocola TaxID=2801341 RepID=A0A934SUT0_9BURK|nr:hypothetical protein [Noviherbaspirillum pedocola]MBK4735561.1 hypothetical protein [Noviherbaspirillum pedocola]
MEPGKNGGAPLVGVDDIGLPTGSGVDSMRENDAQGEPREDEERLERAAGPHGAHTTELVGVDDIGLPSGLQPEDVGGEPAAMAAMASSGGEGGGQGGAPAPQTVHESSPEMAPGDDAAPGTVGTGDDTCPVCHGSGKNASGGQCPNCRGTGTITEGIGGG